MYFIIFDATGSAVGSGFSDNESLPEGAQVCEADAATHYDRYQFANGAIVECEPIAPPPATAAEVLARRDALLALATLRIDPLEDAIDLNIETAADVDALTAWKQYRVALNRIEQQTGFPADVKWPAAPQ